MNKPKQMQQNQRQLNRGYSPISIAPTPSLVEVSRGNHPRENCQGGKSPPSSQSGFTIIESLVAIIVVTILMIGLAPVITLSVATRVQARRVERATQAARSYMDGVKTGAIPFGPTESVDEDSGEDLETYDAITEGNNLNAVDPPPIGDPDCDADNAYCKQISDSVLYCVDGDGEEPWCNSFQDFIIQAFGKIPTQGGDPNRVYPSYKLGVRVYRADAFTSDFTQDFEKDATQSSFTGGIGLSSTQAPLVIMSTEIAVEENNMSQYRSICENAGINGC